MDEEIIDWVKEANGVINDVNPFVHAIVISTKLKVDVGEIGVFINVETRERSRHTVLLCDSGFKVVANEFDQINKAIEDANRFFETPYSLLQSISPSYNQQFGRLLAEKLEQISTNE